MKDKNIKLDSKFYLVSGLSMSLYIVVMYLSFILSPYIYKYGVFVALYFIATYAVFFGMIFPLYLKAQIFKIWGRVFSVVWLILVLLFDYNLRNRIEWNNVRSITSTRPEEWAVGINNEMGKMFGTLEGWIIVQGLMLLFIIGMHIMLYLVNKKRQSNSKEIGTPVPPASASGSL